MSHCKCRTNRVVHPRFSFQPYAVSLSSDHVASRTTANRRYHAATSPSSDCCTPACQRQSDICWWYRTLSDLEGRQVCSKLVLIQQPLFFIVLLKTRFSKTHLVLSIRWGSEMDVVRSLLRCFSIWNLFVERHLSWSYDLAIQRGLSDEGVTSVANDVLHDLDLWMSELQARSSWRTVQRFGTRNVWGWRRVIDAIAEDRQLQCQAILYHIKVIVVQSGRTEVL